MLLYLLLFTNFQKEINVNRWELYTSFTISDSDWTGFQESVMVPCMMVQTIHISAHVRFRKGASTTLRKISNHAPHLIVIQLFGQTFVCQTWIFEFCYTALSPPPSEYRRRRWPQHSPIREQARLNFISYLFFAIIEINR